MISDDLPSFDRTVYLEGYLHLADTHWFEASCVFCSRTQAISVHTAIRLAGTGSTFAELQRRLQCWACAGPMSMSVCSDPRPAQNRDQDGMRPETLGR
jgi:hypothetical protein